MKIGKKILVSIFTIWIIISISFLMVHFMPGEPIIHLVGEERYYEMLYDSPEEIERTAEKFGLNDPLGKQYLKYLKSIFTLDFGIAYSNKKPVIENVLNRIHWTLILSVPTFIIGAVLGAILGIKAGWKPGSTYDKIMTPIMLFFNTVPTNCIGIIFLVTFAFKLGWFPVNGMYTGGLKGIAKTLDIIYHAILPVTLLTLFRTAGNFLNIKSNVSLVRNEEYVTTAYAKGLTPEGVLKKHVIKNAMLPYVTTLCTQLGNILSGSMILEVIFGWKGMGQLFYTSVKNSDYPTAQACFLISATLTVLAALLGDFIIAMIDPRIREKMNEY